MRRRFGLNEPSWRLSQSESPAATSLDSLSSQRSSDMPNLQFNIQLGAALGKDERGAIWPVLPAVAFPEKGGLHINPFEKPSEEIRTALLFFDKFDIPSQRLIGGMEWCEPEFRRIGVLTPSMSNGSGNVGDFLRELPFHTFEARERSEPGRWAFSRPAQALGFSTEHLSPYSAVSLTLQNALPVFARDVPLEDILEFKVRAWSELQALRTHLDELCLEVGRNGTNSFEHTVVFRRFEQSLQDHIKLMNQSNRDKVWQSLKASCDLPGGVGAGGGVIGEALITGTVDIGTLVTGALVIGVKTVAGLKRKRTKGPFEYLTSAHFEL